MEKTRRSVGACALVATLVALAVVDGANAQEKGNLQFWNGINPRNFTLKKVDYTKAMTPATAAAGVRVNSPSLAAGPVQRFFHGQGWLSSLWRPKVANAPVLPQSQNIFQPNPPQGLRYLFSNP